MAFSRFTEASARGLAACRPTRPRGEPLGTIPYLTLGLLSIVCSWLLRCRLLRHEPRDHGAPIATGLYKLGLAMKQQAWLLANEEGISTREDPRDLSVEGRDATELSTPLASPANIRLVARLVDKGPRRQDPRPAPSARQLIGLRGRPVQAPRSALPTSSPLRPGALSGAEQDAFCPAS